MKVTMSLHELLLSVSKALVLIEPLLHQVQFNLQPDVCDPYLSIPDKYWLAVRPLFIHIGCDLFIGRAINNNVYVYATADNLVLLQSAYDTYSHLMISLQGSPDGCCAIH